MNKSILQNLIKDEYGGIELLSNPKFLIGKYYKSVFPKLRSTPHQYRIKYKSYYSALDRLEKDQYKTKGKKTADLNKVRIYDNLIPFYEYFGKFILDSTGKIVNVLNKINKK